MKVKISLCTLALLACATSFDAEAQKMELTGTFNESKVILPSSEYTPDAPYTATVWVFNEGKRYADADYNHIWGEPDTDSDGYKWYEPEYKSDDASGWETARAPFSSDAFYKGQQSHRWITSDITGEIYMRRTFTLESLPEGIVYLACGHDDGPSEWYINGELVHSVSDGWKNEEYKELSADQKALLKTDGSENLIAVHVHQNWGGAFADCGLYGADMSLSTTLLNTVADGEWPCKYYMLNYNSDIEVAEAAGWAAQTEDESDWIDSLGPMSNDDNMFLITQWPSQVRPILIRRHFTFTADNMASLAGAELKLTCSYDENPKIYLNGNLIWSATGWNDNNYVSYTLTKAQNELLHEGDNVLAVSLSQGEGGGHIDYGLQIVAPYENSGIISAEADGNIVREADNRVFNLHGQYLGTSTDRLPRGIYVVGGKKTVIK
ncbi:MAG: hypothetical protein HDS68_02925 [Bacteroidales bacterium]|nr:hypothetical protein [Bacteroidales bacterium]